MHHPGRRRPAPLFVVVPLVVPLVASLLAAACSGGGAAGVTGRTTAPTAAARPPIADVAVGASETIGIGADDPATQAWPVVLAGLLRQGGRQVALTTLGVAGSTTAQALADQVPKAEALQPPPTLTTVWLNVNDLLRQVPADAYRTQLGELVHRLRRGGATKVLVANVPAVDRLPVYTACLTPAPGATTTTVAGVRCFVPLAARVLVPTPDRLVALVDAYDAAVAQVAAAEGATVVDLHAASLQARAGGTEATLVGRDGFHPSTAGHAAVAATFAAAARAAGV